MYTDRHAEGGIPGLRSERAYGQLKAALLSGDFPLNIRLGEERLAAELGVSRTPVREALSRLHTEGLVVRGSEGGFVPATPDVVAMRHLYEARASLELASLRRPFSQGVSHDEAVLLALRQDWTVLADEEPAADPSFVLLDEAFHVTLAEAAGNPALVDLLRHVNERIRLARMQDFLDAGRVAQTVHEHLGIVDAVLEGDLVKAEARFVSHLDLSMAVVEQRVMRALARMAGGSDGRR